MPNYASLYSCENAFVDDAVECLLNHAGEVGVILLRNEVALRDAVAACIAHGPLDSLAEA